MDIEPIARTAQTAVLLLAVYVMYLSIKRLPIVSTLRFRADHIYYAIVAILLLSSSVVYLQTQALTLAIKPFWWVISVDRIIQLSLFIGILNCACGCTSGENSDNVSICDKKH